MKPAMSARISAFLLVALLLSGSVFGDSQHNESTVDPRGSDDTSGTPIEVCGLAMVLPSGWSYSLEQEPTSTDPTCRAVVFGPDSPETAEPTDIDWYDYSFSLVTPVKFNPETGEGFGTRDQFGRLTCSSAFSPPKAIPFEVGSLQGLSCVEATRTYYDSSKTEKSGYAGLRDVMRAVIWDGDGRAVSFFAPDTYRAWPVITTIRFLNTAQSS